MKVLVTGCTGLVGHGICLYLLKRGWEVWGSSRKTLKSRHERFHPVKLDIYSDESVKNLGNDLVDVDAVVHSAALIPAIGADDGISFFETNLLGTYRIMNLACRTKIQKFIYISSTAIVDQGNEEREDSEFFPKNEYVSSKIVGEIVVRQFLVQNKLNSAILRISAPYGYIENSKAVIPKFISFAKENKDITLWGTGKREQVFTFVDDIGSACELALGKSVTGIFNVCGASPSTMKELADSVLNAYRESSSKIVYSGERDPEENRERKICIEKAKRELGFFPQYDLRTGLKKIADAGDEINFFEEEN